MNTRFEAGRPCVLYATRGYTEHDRRFTNAAIAGNWDVVYLALGGTSRPVTWDLPESRAVFPEWAGTSRDVALNCDEAAAKELRHLVELHKPVITHAGPLTDVAPTVLRVVDLPTVVTSWGFDLLQDAKVDAAARSRAHFAIQRAHLLHTDCDAASRIAMELGANQAQIVTFPWGVDLARFMAHPTSRELPIRILSARRLESLYNVDTVIAAFSSAVALVPHISMRLTIVGEGSLEKALRSQVRALEVDDLVDWTGHVSERTLARVMRASDIYVSAASVDGSSISLLQAMACGAIPVVTAIDSNCEWVIDRWNGRTFCPQNTCELGEIIAEQAGSGNDRDLFRKRSRAIVEDRADWTVHSRTLIDMYKAVLKSGA